MPYARFIFLVILFSKEFGAAKVATYGFWQNGCAKMGNWDWKRVKTERRILA
jgi:hypothetical protein